MFATSLFKVAVFFTIWTIIWLPIAVLISRQLQWQPIDPLTVKQKLILVLSLYILAPPVLWWQTQLEGLSFADLGWNWRSNLAVSGSWGLAIALVSLGIVFSLEFGFSLIDWHWQNWRVLRSSIAPILGLSLVISLVEELVFRGYVLRELAVDLPYWLAAALASLVFAILHLIWERKQTMPQLPGLWLMGMVLVAAKIVDRGSLGLAVGLHAGWIWGLTCIDSAGLITYKEQNWITGINGQPLAGIAGMVCLLVTALLLWILNIVPAVTG